ncbi:MAG TPA: DUF2383 domain-containing protein [Dyella sp.]|nr:DUF2383 domain-containing protein [Dyella sp.]
MSLASQPVYNTLIRRSIDLQRLCKQAAQQVAEPGLRAVLQENAAALELLILDLQMQLSAQGGRPATRGCWNATVTWSRAARWVRSANLSDSQWIRLLARREAALLERFAQVLDTAPAETALELGRLARSIEAVHLDMRSLALAAR